jgi:hypothetical protein
MTGKAAGNPAHWRYAGDRERSQARAVPGQRKGTSDTGRKPSRRAYGPAAEPSAVEKREAFRRLTQRGAPVDQSATTRMVVVEPSFVIVAVRPMPAM